MHGSCMELQPPQEVDVNEWDTFVLKAAGISNSIQTDGSVEKFEKSDARLAAHILFGFYEHSFIFNKPDYSLPILLIICDV